MDRLHPHYIDAVRYLYDRINFEKSSDRPYDQRAYRLARMEHFLSELGDPHLAAPVVHVAGTKGKGSVSWLLAEAFRRSGLTVGLYTSPHLMHLEERFVVNGSPCEPAELTAQIESLRRAAEATTRSTHGCPTFFEMTTAIAWMLFAFHKTHVNVIEVGLGGRLDSTNVCHSSLAVITSISLDHQQQLGNTITQIAGEKAGIIKPQVPVVSGAQHPDARQVIRDKCASSESPLWELGIDFHVSRCSPDPKFTLDAEMKPCRGCFDFSPASQRIAVQPMSQIPVRMLGDHQTDNAAISIAAWQRLISDGWSLSLAHMRDSISETQVACRIEVVLDRPTVILDTAHNAASMEALLTTLSQRFGPSKKTIVFACSKDKQFEVMIRQLLDYADRFIVTQFQNNPRAVPVERLESMAKEFSKGDQRVEILSSPTSTLAVEYALKTSLASDLICVTGSFFLASEVRPLFLDSPRSSGIHASPFATNP